MLSWQGWIVRLFAGRAVNSYSLTLGDCKNERPRNGQVLFVLIAAFWAHFPEGEFKG